MENSDFINSQKQKIDLSKIDFANYDQISKCLNDVFETEDFKLFEDTISQLEPAQHLVETWLNNQVNQIDSTDESLKTKFKSNFLWKSQWLLMDQRIGKLDNGDLTNSGYFWKTILATELRGIMEYFFNVHSKEVIDTEDVVDHMCEFIDYHYNQDGENGQTIDLNLISTAYADYKQYCERDIDK